MGKWGYEEESWWQPIAGALISQHEKIYTDLIAIANKGEFEDMRQEVENYFKNK